MPRKNPCSYLPRRLQIVASLTGFVLFCILFLGTSTSDQYDPYLQTVPYGPKLQSGAHQAVNAAHQVVDRIPKLPVNTVNAPAWLNPFGARAHSPPPEQANSTSGEAKWFSDWKWQNPFSSSITMDEERSVLPPEKLRPPIYTYFDPAGRRKDDKSAQAERQLLQIWRRAWWAKGFKPVVLGPPEARNNPLFRTLNGLEVGKEMEFELQRWLAWGNMGSGILCNWLALPMAPYDDPLLAFLRRGEYPDLTRYSGLESGLFVGSKDSVEKLIKSALASPNIKEAKTVFEAVSADTFTVDDKHSSIAFYSTTNIRAKYPLLKEKLDNEATRAEALSLLPSLINSHLHTTWQNTFTSGIAVLKPLPQQTTSLIDPAISIARNLTQCPKSPIPSSCPPNTSKCSPCVATHELLISTPPVFRNSSTLFTIATVPHPYTLLALLHARSSLPTKFVRRETVRDSWILAATRELLGTGPSSFARLRPLKDAIASDYSQFRTLWLTAEHPFAITSAQDLEELDWTFGFSLPRSGSTLSNGKSETPVPGPERRPPPPKQEFEGTPPSEAQLASEKKYFQAAKVAVEGVGGRQGVILKKEREVVEAWNLADTEAWKFVRAFGARQGVERRRWEEDEERFSGGRGLWGRFVDKVT